MTRIPEGSSLPERFWAKVDFEGGLPAGAANLGNCWEWTGRGMGFLLKGVNCKPTRLAYLDVGLSIPSGVPLRRHCANSRCIRPSHGRLDGDPELQGDLGLPARFWSKVEKTESCWLWTRSLSSGYAQYQLTSGDPGSLEYGHRVVYAAAYGGIPEGAHIDHICFNRACVNPEHLRAVSPSGNQQNRSGAARSSRLGVRGVSPSNNGERFVARGTDAGRTVYIGTFDTVDQAAKAASEWRRARMPFSSLDQREEVAA